MKRDCGEGELIPHEFEVVWCVGATDDEVEQLFKTLSEANEKFEEVLNKMVIPTQFSNVRLYVKDKQGYANCIRSSTHAKNGMFHDDRRSALNG